MEATDRCKNFIGRTKCKAGIEAKDLCIPECVGSESPKCICFDGFTDAEKVAHRKAIAHLEDCLKRNVSPCCESKIDTSRVITEGRHKGHGPRMCSKCGRVVFIV